MSKHCDVAISHQWENPLNYLYLDIAWMGWSILHNTHLCKDFGYYYDGFNYTEASEILNSILHRPKRKMRQKHITPLDIYTLEDLKWHA